MSGIATTLNNAYVGMPMFALPDAADEFAMDGSISAGDRGTDQSHVSEPQADVFEMEASLAPVVERSMTHADASASDEMGLSLPQVRVGNLTQPQKVWKPPRWTWNPLRLQGSVESTNGIAMLGGTLTVASCFIAEEMFPGHGLYALLGGMFCTLGIVKAVDHGAQRKHSVDECLHEVTARLGKDAVARLALGNDAISDRDYRRALGQIARDWMALNPVDQAAYLRADRLSARCQLEGPIVVNKQKTPISTGFALLYLLERFHGMGEMGAQQEMHHSSPMLEQWNKDYRATLKNGTGGKTKLIFKTEDSDVPEVHMAVKLAAIPAARRALLGVSRKQYERMVKDAMAEWKVLNPVRRGMAHIADRLMENVGSDVAIDLSANWWAIAPGFVLKGMIERLGMTDVFTDGTEHDPAVWYQRYLNAESARPLKVSIAKTMDVQQTVAGLLLGIPQVRQALKTLSGTTYDKALRELVREWNGQHSRAKARYLSHDRLQGFIDNKTGTISPGFIVHRFCERYIGIGENAVRKQFKLDAKVRDELETWYRSYINALNGGTK